MEKQANILSAQQLCIGYKTGHGHVKQVHGDLSFSLRKGELTCLLGANGSGKSTLLRTLSASQPSLSGKILLNGNELSAMSEREISRQIGVVLTDKTQTGGLTVYELVALGRQPHTGFFGKLDRQDRQVVDEAIEAVGISHKAHSYMAQLSDGEKQKAMIAKVLAQECPLVILDEPTAFLDVVSRIEIMTLLHHIATAQNKAILLSTHDIEQALVLADCLWLLRKGHGMRSGITEDLILNGELDTLFDRKEICFDRAHGSYYPSVQWEKEIVVDATDETLLHWTVNALNRNNYGCRISPKPMHRFPASSSKETTRCRYTPQRTKCDLPLSPPSLHTLKHRFKRVEWIPKVEHYQPHPKNNTEQESHPLRTAITCHLVRKSATIDRAAFFGAPGAPNRSATRSYPSNIFFRVVSSNNEVNSRRRFSGVAR